MAYIGIPELQTDTEELVSDAIDYMADQVEDYQPASANLDIVLLEAVAGMAGEIADLQAEIPQSIFRYFGRSLAGVPMTEAAPAVGQSTWTLSDADGHTIEAGWYVEHSSGQTFEVVEDVAVPQGQTTTQTGQVRLVAVDAGTEANGLTGSVDQAEAIAWIESVTLVGETTGGVDEEDEIGYLERLSEELQIATPTPILPHEFVVLALRDDAAGRATAIDLYDADEDETNVERCVTVVVTDHAGDELDGQILDRIRESLEGMREVNFKVFVVSPTYTNVSVYFEVATLPGWEDAAVLSSCYAALEEFISPATWGNRDFAQYSEDRWINTPVLRINDVIWRLRDTPGVAYVGTVRLNDSAADLAMTGVAPLPRLLAIEGDTI